VLSTNTANFKGHFWRDSAKNLAELPPDPVASSLGFLRVSELFPFLLKKALKNYPRSAQAALHGEAQRGGWVIFEKSDLKKRGVDNFSPRSGGTKPPHPCEIFGQGDFSQGSRKEKAWKRGT
jgi:hypothetical protein